MSKKNNIFSTIFRHTPSRVWAITSLATIAVFTTATVVCNTMLAGLLDTTIFGGDKPILGEGGVETGYDLDSGIKDKATAMAHSNAVNIEVCEEGTVMLKNNKKALPLSKGNKISVFGKNSVNIVRSGSGSAGDSSEDSAKKIKSLYDSLNDAGFETNSKLADFYNNSSASGSGRTSNPKMENNGDIKLDVGETPVSSYTSSVESSYSDYSDAALIVLSRIGGEGWDLPRNHYDESSKQFDANRHYLALSKNEEDLIDYVTSKGFKKVVVLINSANPMEIGKLKDNDKVDSILVVGNTGHQGIMALGHILNGEVNPSGHLSDTYVYDSSSNPSYPNFGPTDNGSDRFIRNGKVSLYSFTDYEEGIYVGYRYYETRGAKDESWYNQTVTYPFGYGMSYTDFEWTLKNSSTLSDAAITKDGKIKVEVEVKNTGTVSGKDVVQIYVRAPYTAGGIAKADKVLAGFAKTKELEPNASETLEIEIDPYDFASYDYNDANGNGNTGYEIEKGTYTFFVAQNAHDSTRFFNMNVASGIYYENDPVTGYKVENHFEEADDHLKTIMSRDDFAGTYPVAPTEEERTISSSEFAKIVDIEYTDNPLAEDEDITMPTTGAQNGLKIQDMFGKDYDDENWDKLLDQMSISEMTNMQRLAAFHTADIPSINKPRTVDADGPNGFVIFMGDPTVYDTVLYCSEVIMAQTYNVDLIEKLGEAVGNESLIGSTVLPYTGWYAPAMNIHRNPLAGRCSEYYSEDPFLSGEMGAAEVKGARSKGVVTYLKHFACNEQETDRSTNGNCSFMDEQTLREIYLKPFEKSVKKGNSLGMMTSFNRIGYRWAGGDYNLLTTVLRNEWGFHGAVITDFNTEPGYMNTRQMSYAGGTLDLATMAHDWLDSESPNDVASIRENTHETLYAYANSNAMNKNVVGYSMSNWKILLLIVDIGLGLGIVVWAFFALRSAFNAQKREDQMNATPAEPVDN